MLCWYRYSYTYEHSSYKYMYAHPTSINIFKRVHRLDLEIHEFGHQEYFVVPTGISPTFSLSKLSQIYSFLSSKFHKATTSLSKLSQNYIPT
jgi:hypothetical protein